MLIIQFKIRHLFTYKCLNGSIWPIDGSLLGTTPLGQSEPWSNGNEEVLHIPQSPMTETSPSDAI